MKTGIENLESYGERGWQWDYTDPYTDTKRHYSTGKLGEGLWEEHRQMLGYSQFSLPADRKNAYNALRRYYVRRDGDAR